MSIAIDTILRGAAGGAAVALLGFGFFGWAVAHMAGFATFPIADAIEAQAVQGQVTFLVWLASGAVGFPCLIFAVRP